MEQPALSLRTGARLLVATALLALVGCGATTTQGSRRDPEVVSFEGALQNRYVPAGEANVVVSRLRVIAGEAHGARRPHINLALVVDTSGSMEGPAIAQARDATNALLDQLHEHDRISIVTFDSRTQVLVPSTEIEGGNLGQLREAVSHMEARGTTDLAGGMRVGLEEVVRHYDASGINRVVLLSDGVPNDASQIAALSQVAGERRIAITTLGLGLEYDETLLANIAQASGGRFHYVEEPSAMASVFRDEVLRIQRVVARSTIVELTPGPGVVLEGVVAGSWSAQGNAIRVVIGDLAEGEARDVLVRMRLDPRRAGSTIEAIDAVLTFDDALEEAGRLERRVFLSARASEDAAEIAAGRDESVERDAARMTIAAQTIQAIQVARSGEVERAREILLVAEREALVVADRTGDVRLRAQAAQAQVLDQALPSMAPSMPASEEDARSVRRVHDEAMQVMQTSAR
jgi:Ca-activated chloride channel family protein